MTPPLHTIERFLRKHKLSAQRFSSMACGDRRVIERYRKSGNLSDTMAIRIADFIGSYDPKAHPKPDRMPLPAGYHPAIESTHQEREDAKDVVRGTAMLVARIREMHPEIFPQQAA